MTALPLILASNSPRRHQLMRMGGWRFLVHPVDVDERPIPGETPEMHVVRLAVGKARACAIHFKQDVILLGADTVVVDEEALLGKPADSEEAESMLKKLRGRVHRVFTGIALFQPRKDALLTDLCVTRVPMRSYSDAEIKDYILTGDPLDKAGAYAIQHAGFHPVVSLSGCFASVMGLPLCHLARILLKLGIAGNRDIAAECQREFEYSCPISLQVLAGADLG